VREFKYSFADDSFSAKNLSILNPLQDDEILEMVYQQDPDSIIWMCTTEGKLMGLTYDQSEQVKAWHEHDVKPFVLVWVSVEFVGTVISPMNLPPDTTDISLPAYLARLEILILVSRMVVLIISVL
jgi:hypothetical protein